MNNNDIPKQSAWKVFYQKYDAFYYRHRTAYFVIIGTCVLIMLTCQIISYVKLGKLLPPWKW